MFKEKIFALSYKILSLFPLSWETERRISNFANLFYLVFKEGSKHTLRCEGYFSCSSDFVENYLFKEDTDEKIARLKSGLDDDSQRIVDKVLKRHGYIYTHNLLDDKDIFDSDELASQKVIEQFRKKQKGYYRICALPETFFYHSGLKVLPEAIIQNLDGKDVIDGGAFIGDSAVIFSKEYSFRNIYSFEPDGFNFIKLKENIAKYKMKDVIPVNKGISSKEEKVKLKIQGMASSISPAGSEEIEVISIDKFVESNDSSINIGLIKFDIEGSEYDGIVGALDTIKKFRPVLLISIYHTGKDFFEIKSLLEKLDLGYKFTIKKINPNSSVYETILIAYANNQSFN